MHKSSASPKLQSVTRGVSGDELLRLSGLLNFPNYKIKEMNFPQLVQTPYLGFFSKSQ